MAATVIEFLTTGIYRALYRIRDDLREVIVLGVEHRRGAYRPL